VESACKRHQRDCLPLAPTDTPSVPRRPSAPELRGGHAGALPLPGRLGLPAGARGVHRQVCRLSLVQASPLCTHRADVARAFVCNTPCSIYLFSRSRTTRAGGSRGGGALKLASIVTPRTLGGRATSGSQSQPPTPDASPSRPGATSGGGSAPRERNAVVCCRWHPKGGAVAVALACGDVMVVDTSSGRGQGVVLTSCRDAHAGAQVTCLTWTPSGEYLFSGDDRGVVALIRHGSGSASASGAGGTAIAAAVAAAPGGVVMWHLRVAIVQIDASDTWALISDGLRTSTLHLSGAATSVHALQPLQLGSKTREGPYGACFHAVAGPSALLAARPGRRLWIADTGAAGADGDDDGAGPLLGAVRATLRPGVSAPSGWGAPDAAGLAAASSSSASSCSFGKLLPVGLCALSSSANSVALVDFLGVAVLSWWALPQAQAQATASRPTVASVCTAGTHAFALCMHPTGSDGQPGSATQSWAASVWMLTAPDAGEALVRRAARAGDVPRAVRVATMFGVMDGDLLLAARSALEQKQQQGPGDAAADASGAAGMDDDATSLEHYEALFARAAATARAQQQEASEQQPSAVAAAAAVFAAMSQQQAEKQLGPGSSRSGTLLSGQRRAGHDDDSASDTGNSALVTDRPAWQMPHERLAGGGEESASVRSASVSGRLSPTSLSQRSASIGAASSSTASALRAALAAALPPMALPALGLSMPPQSQQQQQHGSRYPPSSRASSRAASPPPPMSVASSVPGGSSAGTSPSQSPHGSPRPRRPSHTGSQVASLRLGHSWHAGASSELMASAPPSAGRPGAAALTAASLHPRGEFVVAPEVDTAANAVYAPRYDADELLGDLALDVATLDEGVVASCDAQRQPLSEGPHMPAEPLAVLPLRRARRRRHAIEGLSASSVSLQQLAQGAVSQPPAGWGTPGMNSDDEGMRDDWTDTAAGADFAATVAAGVGGSAPHSLRGGASADDVRFGMDPQHKGLSRSASSLALFDPDNVPSPGSSLSDAAAMARLLQAASSSRRTGDALDVDGGERYPGAASPRCGFGGSPGGDDGLTGALPVEDVELGDGWARLGGIDWPPGDTSASSDDDDEGSGDGDSDADSDDDLVRASDALDRFDRAAGDDPARGFTARLALLGRWDSHVDAAASGGAGDAAIALATMAADADVGNIASVRARAARRRLWAAGGAADALAEALQSLDATHLVAWLRVWTAARAMSVRAEAEAAHHQRGGADADSGSEDDSHAPRAVRRLARVSQLERRLDDAAGALRLSEPPASSAVAFSGTPAAGLTTPKRHGSIYASPESPCESPFSPASTKSATSSVYTDAMEAQSVWSLASPTVGARGRAAATHAPAIAEQHSEAPSVVASRPGGIQLLADELLLSAEDPAAAGTANGGPISPLRHGAPSTASASYWLRSRLLRGLELKQRREVLTAALVSALEDVAADASFQGSAKATGQLQPPVATLLRLAEDACHATGDADWVLRCCTEALDAHGSASKGGAAGAGDASPYLDAAAYLLAQRLMGCHLRMGDAEATSVAVLEPLDAHLWAPPHAALGRFPQLRAVLAAEMAPAGEARNAALGALPFLTARDGEDAASPRRTGSLASDLGGESPFILACDPWSGAVPMPAFLEEPGHWGVRLRLTGAASGAPVCCPRCQLPLVAPSQGSTPLAVFPCGHAYHEACIPERACLACLAARGGLLHAVDDTL
jgi:hypothetical protein